MFEGARLIAGDGRAPLESSAILVENDRFTRVGRKGEIPLPRGAARVDLTGKTIIPGLISLHAHVGYLKGVTFAAENYTRDNIIDHLNRFLYYGIVGVMSTGTDPGELPYQLRDEPHPGALFRTAGRGLAAPNASTGNLAMRAVAYGVATEEDARQDVRELAAKKPDFIKIWVDDRNGAVQKLSPALYRAIIDEAHKHNLRVMAHVYYLTDARDLVQAGVDGFLHLVRDEEMDDGLVQMMKDKRVFVTPNLGTSEAGTYAGKPAWLDDPVTGRDRHRRRDQEGVGRVCRPRDGGPRRRRRDTAAGGVVVCQAAAEPGEVECGGRADCARQRHRHREHVLRLRRASRIRAAGRRRDDADAGDRRGDPHAGGAPPPRSARHAWRPASAPTSSSSRPTRSRTSPTRGRSRRCIRAERKSIARRCVRQWTGRR